ncbi:alanine dehydrogenase [Clostridium sp. D2Q-11]|uniref:alanine dehydrogenase n=1 Tax=Anaeromonas frigoriresistens TaxID=2683708 RepID=A0A942UUQ1_9FIRM|nr:alanine dehydrogenase [Anaeromonas frigoriresistens]MBS4537835.1 alanine dehydrogenase [Anaeromonas frigoriresistens]
MIIGIPKEIKPNEYRVACDPNGVKEIINNGHEVLIQKGAGLGSGFQDREYEEQGARIVDSARQVYEGSELIYKVREVFPEEFEYLSEGQIIFAYIHSNVYRKQTDAMLEKKIIGISYEDITNEDGEFPLLKPMSVLAGKGGFLAALNFSQKIQGGRGIFLSRIEGIKTPEITIIGAGNSGLGAAELASSLGNRVTVLDIDIEKMERAKSILPLNVEFLYSNKNNIEMCLKRSDVVINCIRWARWKRDHLITRDMLGLMKEGSLIVDVACDEGGAIETCRVTTHDDPIYEVDGIIHYCVDNITSAFSQTATQSLSSTTLPYLLQIANRGVEKALMGNKYLRRGLSFYYGKLISEETGKKQQRPYITAEEALGITY